MTHTFSKWIGLAGISILLSACGGESNNSLENSSNDSSGTTQETSASASFQYDVSGILKQTIAPAGSASESEEAPRKISALAFTAEQILRGQLSATAIGGINDGQVEIFTWTIYLDEDTLEASSNTSLNLVPGNYDFELLMTKGNLQYAGYNNQTMVDGTNDINMTIKPIIGDVISDVTIIDRLAYFKFQYSAAELSALVTPSIGIQVDAGAEQVFTINKTTGMSNAFVNLTTGQHNFLLKLYDASVQVGKSVVAQQSQAVSFGTDLAMDIVPLHSEVQFILTEDGGDANLSITLPAEVVNEVGGVANLVGTLALVGTKNPLQESALNFVVQGDGSFKADLIFTDLQYELVTLSLTFSDKTTTDQIASCNNAWTLDNQNQSFACNITLIRRAVINSNILAVLGLTVVNEQGEPVSGTVITNAAGDSLGITGSGTYGTAGYLKLYLKAGEHAVTATNLATSQAQTGTVILSPLQVDNLLLVLADTNPAIAGFTGAYAPANWTLSGVGGRNMSETDLAINSGGGGVVAEITIPADGTIAFDWNMVVNSAGQYGDTIGYIINDTGVTLSAAGSASGAETGIKVSAGDVLKFSTWGTTQSSNYSANFNNFSYTPTPPPIVGFTGDFAAENWALSGVASSNISETALTANVGSGGGGVVASITIPTNGTISFDWNMVVNSAGQNGDNISYVVNGTGTILSAAGSASGTVTEIAVSAGDTFTFQTWGTTQSSSYNATFNNFGFAAN